MLENYSFFFFFFLLFYRVLNTVFVCVRALSLFRSLAEAPNNGGGGRLLFPGFLKRTERRRRTARPERRDEQFNIHINIYGK